MAATGYEAQTIKVDEQQPEDATVVDFNELVMQQENILLKYDTVQWKFKMFTMSTIDYKKYQAGNTDVTELVISETGATGKFSIDEVQMTTTAPCTNSTKNSTLLRANITMSEQGSMTFYDDLQAASVLLGYSQLMDVPMFLELTFVGYDRYGENQPTVIPGTTRLWRIRFNKIDSRFDNTGATTIYDIETSPMTFVMPPEDWRLTEQVEMIATRDVSAFIAEFSKKINAIANTQYGYLTHMFANDLQPDNFYTFHVHPKIGNLMLINDSAQDTTKDKTASGEQGSKRYVFEAKQTIANVIDCIMDSAQAKGAAGDTGQVQKRQFVNVVPVSNYVGYDIFRKRHVYRYDVYVLPYRTLDYQDVDDTKNGNTAFDLKTLFAEAYPDTKYNMKRYDFQWSGRNTEILDLDLKFDSAYTMIAAKNVFSLYDSKNRKGSKSAELKPQDQIASAAELQKLYLRKVELDNQQTRTAQEQTELEATTVQLNSTTQLEGEQEQLIRPTAGNRAFLENVTRSVDLKSAIDMYNGTKLHLQVPVDYRNIEEKSSSTDDSNASQTEVSKRLIRSNYYNSSTLMTLNMNVVGDPYWLGKSELDTIADLRKLATGENLIYDQTELTMNVLDCEPCLLLNLHPAKGYDYRTGLLKEDPQSIFAQSIYRVQTIQSTFSDDGFVQDLKGAIIARSINRKR